MKRFLFALALLGASPLPALHAQPKPATAPANTIAATVNGDTIPLDDLNRMVTAIQIDEPSLQGPTPEAKARLAQVRAALLDELITNRLLAQAARAAKVAVTPKDVDDAFAKLKTNFETPRAFADWMLKGGKNEADVKRTIADELSIREWARKATEEVTVTPDDFKTFYNANPEEFKVPEGVRAHHILLAINPAASPADKTAVQKRAAALLKQLEKSPKNFESLAKQNSDDMGTKDNGGDLGAFPRGAMVGPFNDAVFDSKTREGDIIGPVSTEFGLHIIRLDKKIPASTVPLSTIEQDPQFKAILLKQKIQKRLDDQIKALKAAAKIQKNV